MRQTKTKDLAEKIRAGRYKVDGGALLRWVPSRSCWVRDTTFRADVVRRAGMEAAK